MATRTYQRHRWTYPAGLSSYEARSRTCQRCGITGRTFGVGAGRIWTYQNRDGSPIRRPACIPLEEK